ncbi:MAG: C39 family peptidase [Phycisphaerae bacterium]|nr:C39 family peptidase [Phycisphaerae bacterium]
MRIFHNPRRDRQFLWCASLVVGSLATFLDAQESPKAAASRAVRRSVVIQGVPHILQKPDFCGEACLAMWSKKSGYKVSQNWVFGAAGVCPELGRGAFAPELYRAIQGFGLDPGPKEQAWAKMNPTQADAELNAQFDAMLADLHQGVGAIVCMHYDEQPNTTEHFRLVLGYDAKTDEVIYHEPAVRKGAYRRMKRKEFLELWPLKYKQDEWTVIRFRLERIGLVKLAPEPKRRRLLLGPDGQRNEVDVPAFTDADYAQHIRRLKQNPVVTNLTYVVEKPFVVAGNESPSVVRRQAERTVRWAVERLKKDYFPLDPDCIITIYLLGDKASYEQAARAVLREPPGTPFGFFSESKRCMVMNIATGGGTLVHEIVHAFMRPNFPQCPTWFNEGLASLYEQCGQQGDKIVGYTNWRLAGLQRAIRAKAVPSFKHLTATTTNQFYGDEDSGLYYAQARYLLYYLQQNKKLRTFYRRFVENVRTDPTGYQTLQAVLDLEDMKKFQADWEDYCLRLRFPE